jgi:DNA-directed RNA polymerase specialized sigma24 family protein
MLDEALLLRPSPVTTDQQTSDVRAAAAAAADELYTRHVPLLRYIAVSKFRVPRADADALVHDVFATYFARSNKVENPRPYLIGAICNAARYYWRERKNEEAALGNADPPVQEGQEQLVDGLSRKLLVATTLSRIGSKCRDLLSRYYLDGESTAAIATGRETTTDYILFLLHQCRKRAREIVRSLMVS